VVNGEADLGITGLTQILTTSGAELVGPLPPELQYDIQFAAGVSATSKAPDAARELVNFFFSPPAIAVIKSQGMVPARQ
jgi:molybdate transport system substrate-binding protein